MKKLFTIFLTLFTVLLFAQSNSSCDNAIRVCLNNPVSYPAITGAGQAEAGPFYGCLSSRPNPAWFYFKIDNPGTHTIAVTNSQNRDLDFMLWGPFTSENDWCDSLTESKVTDCSYAGGATETIEFTSTATNRFYVLVITNFSNNPTNVTLNQTSGTGTYDCNFVAPCQISLLTAVPGGCDTLTNQYTLSGQVWTFNPPQSNSLIIGIGENTISLNPPFTNPVNYTISGLPSDGQTQTLTAFYAANTNCTESVTFTAPAGCIPCNVSISSNSPVCEGGTLQFNTVFNGDATYSWAGPNSFGSDAQNPEIPNITATEEGIYQVLITGENCVSEREIEVDVIQAPTAQALELSDSVCTGEIILFGVVSVPGAAYSWLGPNGFTAGGPSPIISSAGSEHTGEYMVSLSVNGCTNGADSIDIVVLPSPVISLIADTVINPQSGNSLFIAQGAPNLQYFWNFFGNTTLISNVLYTNDRDSAVVFWDGGEGLLGVEITAVDENGCFAEEVRQQIQIVINTGITGVMQDVVQPSPNPSAERVIFNGLRKAETIVISDLSGRVVMLKHLEAGSALEVSNLPVGLYFWQVQGKNEFGGKLQIVR